MLRIRHRDVFPGQGLKGAWALRGPRKQAGSGRRTRSGRRSLTAFVVVAVLTLAGCSGTDDDPAPSEPGASGADRSETSRTVVTDAALGTLRGRLSTAASDEAVSAVVAVVDDWIERGFGGSYPRTDFAAAFAAFTPDARTMATKQAALLSNAEVGADLERVDISERVIRVDLLAPRGKLAGATARIRVTVTLAGGVERTDVLSGRLLLTPVADDWRVFGFDIARGEGGA